MLAGKYFSKNITLTKFHQPSGLSKKFRIDTYYESIKLEGVKLYLLKYLDGIIEEGWGKFSKDFIMHHVLKAQKLKIVFDGSNIIGFASASYKYLLEKKIFYLEFTVIQKTYRGYNLSTLLNADMISEEIFFGLIDRRFSPLDVVTITRNMRVIGSLSRFASYIYPDPKQFEKYGKLNPANNFTWRLFNEILRQSWNPKRKLLREGGVVFGSYELTPWLIVPKVPKHYKRSIQDMGEAYLQLSRNVDREFIVYVRFNVASTLKYLIWRLKQTQK